MTMTYNASHRFARIAPRKARLIAELIQYRNVDDALVQLRFSKKRAAAYFRAVLESAVANAEEQDGDVRSLFVTRCHVDEGPTIKRFRPKDRGRAHPILKRTSHLHVTLGSRIEANSSD